MEKAFRFKKFEIRQDRCAMKVGTDGVLLGAWASLDNRPDAILDIGAGTGLIALMLAQRCGANLIEAVEIEENAYLQCVENFRNSPWPNRLFCHHSSFEEFAVETGGEYDLIVSNPPFYTENVPGKNRGRDLARQASALPIHSLLRGVVALLAPGGVFCTILPFSEEKRTVAMARKSGLYPRNILRVRGNPGSETKRSLLEFHAAEGPVHEGVMVIETQRHQYTEAYRRLTAEFYLNMQG